MSGCKYSLSEFPEDADIGEYLVFNICYVKKKAFVFCNKCNKFKKIIDNATFSL